MKPFLYIMLCITLGVLTTSCLGSNSDSEVILVSADEMEAILKLDDVQLIDVRTPKEHNQIRIANSQNIDFNSPTFDADISNLDKSKPVVLYCKGGTRSARCAKKLIEAGFEKVYDLEGGLSKWQHSKNLEIETKS